MIIQIVKFFHFRQTSTVGQAFNRTYRRHKAKKHGSTGRGPKVKSCADLWVCKSAGGYLDLSRYPDLVQTMNELFDWRLLCKH